MSDLVTKGGYTWTETHANGFDKVDWFNLPKAGASAGAGVGYHRVKEGDCGAEAKGPNAEAGAEASLASLSASAKAELGSVSLDAEDDGAVFHAEAKGPNAEAGAEASLASLGASASAKAEVGSVSVNTKVDGAVFDAKAKGPNAKAGAKASLTSLGASAKAELASVSTTAGNLKTTLGLAADAKVKVGLEGVEAKVLGTGFKFGRKVGFSVLGSGFEIDLLGDTIGRAGKASAKGLYAGTKNDSSGVSAAAGVGEAGAQWSVFDVGAKGPNAGAEAGVGGAIARAEVASASAAVGNMKGTVGLAVDTGATVADSTVEAKVLGTGVKLGRTMGFSLFGTGFEFNLW